MPECLSPDMQEMVQKLDLFCDGNMYEIMISNTQII